MGRGTELFGADDRAESERFLFLLASVMREPPAGVEPFCLFTIRADGATRLSQIIADLNLEVPETLPLLPLPQSSYRDVILKPLEVVGRRGQNLTISPTLVDRLVADATGADALPMLAFLMSHLIVSSASPAALHLPNTRLWAALLARSTWRSRRRRRDRPTLPRSRW
jgi:hypothetical protein